MEMQKLIVAKSICESHKAEEFTLRVSRPIYPAIASKTVWPWCKNRQADEKNLRESPEMPKIDPEQAF